MNLIESARVAFEPTLQLAQELVAELDVLLEDLSDDEHEEFQAVRSGIANSMVRLAEPGLCSHPNPVNNANGVLGRLQKMGALVRQKAANPAQAIGSPLAQNLAAYCHLINDEFRLKRPLPADEEATYRSAQTARQLAQEMTSMRDAGRQQLEESSQSFAAALQEVQQSVNAKKEDATSGFAQLTSELAWELEQARDKSGGELVKNTRLFNEELVKAQKAAAASVAKFTRAGSNALGDANTKFNKLTKSIETTITDLDEAGKSQLTDAKAEFEQQLGAANKRLKEQLEQAQQEFQARTEALEDQSTEHLAVLERHQQTAKELLQWVSGATLAHGYSKVAKDAKEEASKWQTAAAVCFSTFAVLAIGYAAYSLFAEKQQDWLRVVFRLLGLGSLLVIGGLFSAQARDRRKWSRFNQRHELSLLTLEPYLEGFTDERERQRVRSQLVKRFFNPEQELDHRERANPAVIKESLAPAVELLKLLQKRK